MNDTPAPTVARDVVETLHWLAGLAPTRLTGSHNEWLVQDAIRERLEAAGCETSWQQFRYPPHIYGSLAMHFGLVLALAPLARRAPWLAAAGHTAVIGSFLSEVVRRRPVLRRLWPAVDTQNLLMTLPARGPMRRRVVCLAHADSAYTGLMFEPHVLRVMAAPPPPALSFLRKQLRLPLIGALGLLGLDVLGALAPDVKIPGWTRWLLAFPPALAFALNADVVLRDRVVPGAVDNLSGCAAQVVLAEEVAKEQPDDVEFVFAFTGAEEAGTAGAAHLARSMRDVWDPAVTDVLVLDTLSNGELFILEEGELVPIPVPARLAELARTAAREVSLPEPGTYPVPAGATDALPFLVEGYRAIALTCIDPEQHAPRNYHHPNDTADRVDPEQLRATTRLYRRLIELVARG